MMLIINLAPRSELDTHLHRSYFTDCKAMQSNAKQNRNDVVFRIFDFRAHPEKMLKGGPEERESLISR